MPNYINTYLSSIPAGQRDALVRIIEQQKSAGMIASREQFDIELKKLVASLSQDFDSDMDLKTPSLVDATPISSEMLNDNFKAIYTALGGLFHQMNKADATVTRHRSVRNSDHARIKAATNKLLEDISIYSFLRFTAAGWNEAKYSNFWNRKNANTTIKAGEVDERTKKFRLRIGRSRRLQQLAGSSPTKVTVEDMGMGQSEAMSKSFAPERMIDSKLETFWAHLVMADNRLHSTVDGVEMEGAVVRVTVEFPNVEPASCLELLPFGAHPIQISALQYWTGDAWAAMAGWTQPGASLDWQQIGFPEVQTDRIRFLLQQKNFTRNTYLVPRRMFTNSILWEMAVDEQLLSGVREEELTSAQTLAVQANPRFRALISAVKLFEGRLGESGLNLDADAGQELMQTVDAATRVMAGAREGDAGVVLRAVGDDTSAKELGPDDMVEITKVEYLMGLYHIAVEHRDYYPIGIYESPKFDNQGTVYEVALDVNESHVTDPVAGFNLSSVEYEVEVSPERRVPLLPSGAVRVPQELVKINPNTLVGTLRFTPAAAPNAVLRRDGGLTTDFTLVGRVLTITLGFSRNAIYTIDYGVAANQDLFDIDATYNSIPLEKPETFNETDDHGMIKLSFYPYVAWEVINDPANWARIDPEHAKYMYRVDAGPATIDGVTYGPAAQRHYEPIIVLVDGIRASNITEYMAGIHPAFVDSPSQELIYQYIHVGRKIYFSRPIKGATIDVRYRWMTQYVRLVATLRGHQAVVNPYTPLLDNYRLRMRTSRL